MLEQRQILSTLQAGKYSDTDVPKGYLLLTFLIAMSAAESFSQKLLASVVRYYLKQLDGCCLVVKDILGGGWDAC